MCYVFNGVQSPPRWKNNGNVNANSALLPINGRLLLLQIEYYNQIDPNPECIEWFAKKIGWPATWMDALQQTDRSLMDRFKWCTSPPIVNNNSAQLLVGLHPDIEVVLKVFYVSLQSMLRMHCARHAWQIHVSKDTIDRTESMRNHIIASLHPII